MRFDRRFVFAIGFSLLWALLVSVVFYRLAGAKRGQAAVPDTQTVVVAAQPLALGTVVTAELVKTVRVAPSLVPKGAYAKPEDVLGRSVTSPIQPDEPVVDARLAARGSGMGLAPLIPEGMRAISVRVNDVVGVAGFLLPGMRVDVLVTGRPPGSTDTTTTPVLQNVTVLSAGQTLQAEAAQQSIKTPVVTLLVTPAEAVTLTLANNEGQIQLVLRNSNDQKLTAMTGKQLRELYVTGRTVEAVAVAAPPKPPRRVPPPAINEPRAAVPAPSSTDEQTRPAPRVLLPKAESVEMIRGSLKTVVNLK